MLFNDNARLDLVELDLNGGASATQDYAMEQVVDAFQGPASAEDLDALDSFPTGEGGNQSGQTKDMIQVTVRDQDAVQAFEPQPRLHDLSLCSLTAIDQEAVLVMDNNLGRQPATGGRRRSGCTEKNNFKQEGLFRVGWMLDGYFTLTLIAMA